MASSLLRYGIAILAVEMAFAITAIVPPLRERNQFMLFVTAVAFSAWYGGWGPGLMSAFLSAVSANLFIMSPRGAFSVGVEDLARLATFFAIAVFIGFLQSQRRSAEQRAQSSSEELAAARLIQQRLLPDAAPNIPGFDICGISRPARTTGGDLYDYIPLDNGRWAVVLGDVSGHGLGPAFLMSEVRAYVRAALLMKSDPGDVLTICNRIMCDDLADDKFITLFLGVLDPCSSQFQYSAAGHEGYFLERDGAVTKLRNTGLPLGINRDESYKSQPPIVLEGGHSIVLLTDGVADTMNSHGLFFGSQRALELVRRKQQGNARDIIEELWQVTKVFRGNCAVHDDFSVVIIKATGRPALPPSPDNSKLSIDSLEQEGAHAPFSIHG